MDSDTCRHKDYDMVYKPDPSVGQEIFSPTLMPIIVHAKDTGRSTGGYVVKIGTVRQLVIQAQQELTLLKTEAAYMAGVEAGKELKWTWESLGEIEIPWHAS